MTSMDRQATRTEVVVVDINMPFGSMVWFMVKWSIAAIPAFLILVLIGLAVAAVGAGLLGALGAFAPTR